MRRTISAESRAQHFFFVILFARNHKEDTHTHWRVHSNSKNQFILTHCIFPVSRLLVTFLRDRQPASTIRRTSVVIALLASDTILVTPRRPSSMQITGKGYMEGPDTREAREARCIGSRGVCGTIGAGVGSRMQSRGGLDGKTLDRGEEFLRRWVRC